MPPIRVLVAVSHDLVRAGIRAVLTEDPTFQVTAAINDARRTLDLIRELRPCVSILQDTLLGDDSLDRCAEVAVAEAATRVIILSAKPTDASVERALRAGANGLLTMSASADDLRRAVKDVYAGRAVLDPHIVGRVMGWVRHRSAVLLSQRESQVMTLVQAGVTDREIAAALGLSHNTVRTYVRRALDKLACDRRCEATARLVRLEGADRDR